MKIRAGVGKSGNANFDNYARWGTVTPSSNLPYYNGQQQLAVARLENPNLRWESTVNYDAGIEMQLFKGRVSTEFVYYNKQTSDVIMNVSIPVSIGFGSFYDNVGKIENEGLEFTLKTINIRTKNFQWSTNFNIARNWNKITSIGVYSPDAISGGEVATIIGGGTYLTFQEFIYTNSNWPGQPYYGPIIPSAQDTPNTHRLYLVSAQIYPSSVTSKEIIGSHTLKLDAYRINLNGIPSGQIISRHKLNLLGKPGSIHSWFEKIHRIENELIRLDTISDNYRRTIS
jgi:hypothetical protein